MRYDVKMIQYTSLIREVEIPRYQRNYVWKKKNRESFIESVILKFPIGAITTYKNNGKYILIDGLQRITTLKKFYDKPSNVIKFSTLLKICELNKNKYLCNEKSEFYVYMKNWYNNIEKVSEYDVNHFTFGNDLQAHLKDEELCNNILELVDIYIEIMNKLEFNHESIPVIICKDFVDEELPNIFEKMNSGAMKLSKYEVYISKWINYGSIDFGNKKNTEIENDIQERMQKINEDGEYFELERIDTENTNGYYIHEFILQLSKKIAEFPVMKTPRVNEDAIGYELLALILTNYVYGIDKLVKSHFVYGNEQKSFKKNIAEFLMDMENIIISEIEENCQYISKEEKKFGKYYRLVLSINTKYEYDLNSLKILQRNYNNDDLQKLLRSKKEFGTERQTTYLHQTLSDALKYKPTVKVFNITHAGNPHPEHMIRIQVVPGKISKNMKDGMYEKVFGEYEINGFRMYVQFKDDAVLKSNAINKSVYVDYEILEKFSTSDAEVISVIDQKSVEKIMNEEYFKDNYSPFK